VDHAALGGFAHHGVVCRAQGRGRGQATGQRGHVPHREAPAHAGLQLASRTNGLPPGAHTVSSFPSPLVCEPSRARAEPASVRLHAKDSVAAELVVLLLTDELQSPTHEPRALLVTTAPLPLRQDAAAPRTDGSRGRTERATPPAPCDPLSPPSKPQNEIVVSSSSLPTTSPVNPGDELAGFWSSPPAMAPEDYIASISVFPGRFLQVSRDPVVKVKVRDSAVPSKNH
jgi:hypothetical protein